MRENREVREVREDRGKSKKERAKRACEEKEIVNGHCDCFSSLQTNQ